MVIVPFTSDTWRSFSTVLNGVEYTFAQRFNELNKVWYFDLGLASTGETLAAGISILIGCDLLEPYALGIGSMIAVDLQAAASAGPAGFLPDAVDAGPDDLGARVVVVYVAPGEVVA
jgi:hypothetical protein